MENNNNDNIVWEVPNDKYLMLMDFLAKNVPPAATAQFCNMVDGKFYMPGVNRIDKNTNTECQDNTK